MTYLITSLDGISVVKLDIDPPHYLDTSELLGWMEEIRDDKPDLYAELVSIYFQLRKSVNEYS